MDNSFNQELSEIRKISIFGKTKELGRIIGLEGTLEILNLIDEHPRQYTDLEATIQLSHTSLLRRLTMLQNLEIIKKSPMRSKRRETHEYALTIRGANLMKFINSYEKEINVPTNQQKITF